MSQIKTRYVIEETGRVYRQVTQEHELDVSQDIMAKFAQESTTRVYCMFSPALLSPKLVGSVNMAIRGRVIVFTTQLSVLPLRARFSVNAADKCLVPDFTSSSTPMSLEWTPPADMRLFLMVSMKPDTFTAGDQFLVAVDDAGRFYRLPTTNCYENCRLCTGTYDSGGVTYADAIGKALNQFATSEWQADLSDRGGSKGMANSKLLFRFKPLEPEGFEQLAPSQEWQSLCTKVSHEYLTNFITL